MNLNFLESMTESCVVPDAITTILRVTHFLTVAGCATATVLHVLILLCAFKQLRLDDDVVHAFVAMATACHLLLTAFVQPAGIIVGLFPALKSTYFCVVVQVGRWLGTTACGLCLSIIVIDRLLYYRMPMRYTTLSKWFAVAACFVIVLFSAGLVTLLWIFRVISTDGTCVVEISMADVYVYDAYVAVVCVFPAVASFIVSAILFFLVYRRRQQSEFPAYRAPPSVRMDSIRFLLVVSLLALFTLLPARIFMSWKLHVNGTATEVGCPSEASRLVGLAFLVLLNMYPIVYPVLLISLFATYRETAKQLCSWTVGRCIFCRPSIAEEHVNYDFNLSEISRNI